MHTNDTVARLLALTKELRSIRADDLDVALKALDAEALEALRLIAPMLAAGAAHEMRSRAVDEGNV